MVFSSLLFLFLFLPVVLLLYYASPWRVKNLLLFLASLVFYAWGEPIYIALMLFSTLVDYFFGLILDRPGTSARRRKLVLIASVIVNLGVLGFFKYADFLIANVNALLGTSIPATDLPLPIGISFYTFQSMSYIIDIYRGQAKAQRNWIDFATFVALFPQLVAGPIIQYNTIAEQLRSRKVDAAMFAEGIRRFSLGLAKKVLLANNIGLLWHDVSSSGSFDSLPALTAWLGIMAFAFQIYFDFSGYSDMAIGLGLMFGFRFNENFDKPYAAASITDFWRRWHISLGTWFRDYVYIPLGGNRRGLAKQLRNILIVWMLTGIWHGASWNFLLWGLYFGVILIAEKLFILRLLQRLPRWISHAYALLLILIGWVFFAFEELPDVAAYFGAMFAANGEWWDRHSVYLLYTNAILLVMLVLASLPWKRMRLGGSITRGFGSSAYFGLAWYAALLLMSVAYLVDATFNPFLYFRF
ncbi:MBOAT family O-acyltransferase [Paenibacillus sp. LHD-117]|uniref:MBOAT family O-acyltransferase n=1 Tax=Paenibacillus sp. LHD-117 TaxID=3071412 RepID=UPI0027E08F22|nr:MBOAT family O-acyltransferase [Paenibacillus sp. LHD-117]MDQ6421249.1 MBOAT family O-acyltransferase [Paenibacillus sp. LHD-117]